MAAGAGAVLALSGFLPWYRGQAAFEPTLEAWAAIAIGLMATGAIRLLVTTASVHRRRFVGFALGALAFLLTGYVATQFYAFHARHFPDEGVAQHVLFVSWGLWLAIAASLALVWSGVPTTRARPERGVRPASVEEGLPVHVRWGLPLLVLLTAFTVYDSNVGHPAIVNFDESHYIRVAFNMTDGILIDPAWGDEMRPFNFEHPPVGKYFIALGYAIHGEPHDELSWQEIRKLCDEDKPEECAEDAASWRWGSVFVGSLGVLGAYWIGLRLFNRVSAGVFAAGFLLTDNLYYLHARTAMLDVYVIAFLLLAIGLTLGPKPWHRWLGSISYGLALGSKHPALFVLPVLLLLIFMTSNQTGLWMRIRDALIRGAIVPASVYVATYAPYWWIWFKAKGVFGAMDNFAFVHQEALGWGYAADVDPHPYVSQPWTWLTLKRPVFYFLGYNDSGDVAHIYSFGNVFVWWVGTALVLYALSRGVLHVLKNPGRLGPRAAWDWIRHPSHPWQASPHFLSALLFASAYTPFFLLKRDPFNFYFLVAAPFLSIVLAGFAASAWNERGGWRLLSLATLLVAVATFAFFSPITEGTYILERDFQHIMNRIPGVKQ